MAGSENSFWTAPLTQHPSLVTRRRGCDILNLAGAAFLTRTAGFRACRQFADQLVVRPQADICLQTKLQTNCAARPSTSHNKVAWSQRKCRTRADVDAALFLAVGARALLNARLSKFRPLNLRQKFLANDIDSAGRGHRRVTRGGHKSVGRIA